APVAAPLAMVDAASAADLVVSLACPPTAPIVDFKPLFILSQPLFMLVTDSSNQCPSVSNQPGCCSGVAAGCCSGAGAGGTTGLSGGAATGGEAPSGASPCGGPCPAAKTAVSAPGPHPA